MGISRFEGWLKENLVCPRDYSNLTKTSDDILSCLLGHRYPVIDDIPVMLLEEEIPTQKEIVNQTFKTVKSHQSSKCINHDSCGIEPIYNGIDPYVQKSIGATCGRMYKSLIERLPKYPIPEPPLSMGNGRYFLDVGCNWGRWCIGASSLGYIPIGIDPNLDAIKTAYKVAKQLRKSIIYVVADARYLPFPKNTFDVIFSYSVLQHFDKNDVMVCLSEISRTLKLSGISLIQMPNIFGIRNLYNRFKRCFKEPVEFEVHYWRPSELAVNFNKHIGPTSLFIDGFFSLNAQMAHKDVLPFYFRLVVSCSELLRKIGTKIEWLKYFADSLYIKSVKKRI